jgi:hypothetical protein
LGLKRAVWGTHLIARLVCISNDRLKLKQTFESKQVLENQAVLEKLFHFAQCKLQPRILPTDRRKSGTPVETVLKNGPGPGGHLPQAGLTENQQ